MMHQHLVLTLRLHGDGYGTARFHGTVQGMPEWPPAPARVFQALVAGVARGNHLPARVVSALEWLEALPPPIIAAPHRVLGQRVSFFVPNNDADALTDPLDISGIRTGKVVHPSLFSAEDALLYAWSLSGGAGSADAVREAAQDLYQLGRGVDPAWATGEVVDDDGLDARLSAHRGVVHLPDLGARGRHPLLCPIEGSLASLVERCRTPKLRSEKTGKKVRILFTNPPKPRFASVSYEQARDRIVFELRDATEDKPWPWALRRIVRLVETLRDDAVARLRVGLPDLVDDIERTIVGRKADGRDKGPIAQRTHIVPLPSIGSPYADRAVRRFLLDVPSGGSLSKDDVEWAFSGLARANPKTGEVPWVVSKSNDDKMLNHYVGPSRRWRTVTAVVLPEVAKRRRIDPRRMQEEGKRAEERKAEEARAVAAVHVALRHAGIRGSAIAVHVQREPFDSKGVRAEAFAEGTRFSKERLWHVEVELDRLTQGPLVIGDGRFLGLGVMAPASEPWVRVRGEAGARTDKVNSTSGILAFRVIGQVEDRPIPLARALRRAVLALVQAELGNAPLDRFFTGHETDGRKVEEDGTTHLTFQWDPIGRRLLIVTPHWLERRRPEWRELQYLDTLDRALEGLVELRAGIAGRFNLAWAPLPANDSLTTTSRTWCSLTPYAVNRHQKRMSAGEALAFDVIQECQKRRLPRPKVTVLQARGVPGRGLEGLVRLDFAVAVPGPVVLGRTRYLGGGLFGAKGRPSP